MFANVCIGNNLLKFRLHSRDFCLQNIFSIESIHFYVSIKEETKAKHVRRQIICAEKIKIKAENKTRSL